MNSLKQMLRNILRKIRGQQNFSELIKNGLKVGKNFDININAVIDASFCWLIEIGDNVTFAHNVLILAHDASTKKDLGYTKIGKVKIGNNVFLGANSTILPNVSIGNNCIIGAGSVVKSDIPCGSVAVGNPAMVVTSVENYLNKNKEKMENSPVYDYSYTVNSNITDEKKEKMKKDLEGKMGFVV